MKKSLLVLAILMGAVVFNSNAQQSAAESLNCSTSEAEAQMLKSISPEERSKVLKERALLAQQRKEFEKSGKLQKAPNTIIIPTVFHIIHGGGIENITDDQAIGCIDQMNEDYNGGDTYDYDPNDGWDTNIVPEFAAIKADVQFSFALAKLDPDGNPTTGILHYYDPNETVQSNGGESAVKNKYRWPNNMYMNVYVIRSAGGEAGSAWAYYPGVGSTLDGVMSSFWAVGRTRIATPTHYKIMTHEVGHWADLPHTFEGGCNDGDGVADTPPCTTGSGCNMYDNPCGEVANRQNYMDYGYCTVMFTEGQKTRMTNAMNSSASGRNNLWTTANLAATGVTGIPLRAQFYGYQIMTVPGNAIDFIDYSETETGTITSWDWQFPGGTPATHSGQTPPSVTYDTEGTYSITLTVTNSNGQTDSQTYTDYISVQKDIYMQNATFDVTGDAMFYDHGYTGRYGNRTDAELTLRPGSPGGILEVDFTSFTMETGCTTDYLEIYDGPNTSSPSLGTFCGTNNPGTITATHSSGALTFVLHANVRDRFDGWEATVTEIITTPSVPVADFNASKTGLCIGESITFSDRSTGLPDTWTWTFEGGTPGSASTEDPGTIVYNTSGTYRVTLEVSNSLGTDTKFIDQYINVGVGSPIPFSEGFEGAFEPTGWSINNPDASYAWEKRNDAGRNSSSCMIMNNADNVTVGEIDEISLPALDLTGFESISMTFDVAYTKYDAASADELRVYVSTDCGQNWAEIYMKTHTDLETVDVATAQSNNWVPTTDSDWRNELIDLSPYKAESFVLLKFHNTSGYGTRVWIDNVNLQGTVDVSENEKGQFKIYPNPSKGIFNVMISEKENVSHYNVYTLEGQIVKQGVLQKNNPTIDLSSQARGVYFLNIVTENKSITHRLIVE